MDMKQKQVDAWVNMSRTKTRIVKRIGTFVMKGGYTRNALYRFCVPLSQEYHEVVKHYHNMMKGKD